MKIELKLKTYGLISVNSILQKLYDLPVSVKPFEKFILSIGYDVADVMDKKAKNKLKKQDLFDENKQTKITLKYHEAWALKKILIALKPFSDTDFTHHQLQMVIDVLDQKTS